MSFTRFHDDPSRIHKQLEISSYAGRYMLNTPGQGTDLPFFEDPNIRLTHWGSNHKGNEIELENDLRGLTRTLNRDYENTNDYSKHSVVPNNIVYRSENPFVEESRASHPAWMYKDLEHSRWETPFLNPLNGIEPNFHCNIQTRIIEKDLFTPVVPNNN